LAISVTRRCLEVGVANAGCCFVDVGVFGFAEVGVVDGSTRALSSEAGTSTAYASSHATATGEEFDVRFVSLQLSVCGEQRRHTSQKFASPMTEKCVARARTAKQKPRHTGAVLS
jgi:hypothetical protein